MIRTLLSMGLFLAASCLHAQQYPSRPIMLVVPYSAGSDADLAARNLALHASKYLKQTVVPVNRPGASGSIGTMVVRNQPADGYYLLLTRIASQVILPATDRSTPYKSNDFTFISTLETNPLVCAVRAAAPYKSMQDLVADVRKNPGKLNFATVGEGTIQHFAPHYLFNMAGLPKDAAVAVPYQGSGVLTIALVGGQVHFACSNLGAMLGQIRGGTLRALMTTTRQPLKELPDVPTARSLGWPEMERFAAWSALAGPPKLDRQVLARWTEVIEKLSHDPAWIEGVEKIGGIPAIRSPAETDKFVREQYQLYEKLADRLGLRH